MSPESTNKPINPTEDKLSLEMGKLIVEAEVLKEKSAANLLLQTVWKARVAFYSLRSTESERSHEYWLNNTDGTFTHLCDGDFGANIRFTQHPEMKHQSYNFALDAIGTHYIISLGQDITSATEIQSYDVKGMRDKGIIGGYVGGDFRKSVKLDTPENIAKGIKEGFPVEDFAKFVDGFDGRAK